jgi:carboxymethylenebutenolidase
VPDTTYPASAGRLRGYLATPPGAGPWPGVVVIHEAFGLTDDMRAVTDKIAAQGFLAFAPDLLSYGFAPRCLVTTMRTMMRGGGGRAIADIDAAREFVLSDDQCTGKVGVIGFCMGGGFAILAATRGFDAAAPNYGLVPRDAAEALAGSCPMVASYGKRDRPFKGFADRLDRALEANGVERDVKEYPEAGHGFLTEHTGRWAFVERVPGLGYEPVAAADAWNRVFTFFDQHLREVGQS